MRAVLILPGEETGRVIDVDGKLETLQGYVGGYIEHVQLARSHSGGVGMYVHDEGMIRGFPINWAATRLYWGTRVGGIPERLPYCIHGPAVVVGGPDDEGDDEALDLEGVALLAHLGISVDGEL